MRRKVSRDSGRAGGALTIRVFVADSDGPLGVAISMLVPGHAGVETAGEVPGRQSGKDKPPGNGAVVVVVPVVVLQTSHLPETMFATGPGIAEVVLKDAAPSPIASDACSDNETGAVDRAALRKEGDYWTLEYGADLARLKASVGLSYIARLLKCVGKELHALDLVTGRGSQHHSALEPGLQLDFGMSEPLIDLKAKRAYMQRLGDLRGELIEAEQWEDRERSSRIRQELQALEDELAKSLGIGGRQRLASSHSERARVSATKAIRSSVKRIGKVIPKLGKHFEVTIRTGTFCSYRPEVDGMKWTVEE